VNTSARYRSTLGTAQREASVLIVFFARTMSTMWSKQAQEDSNQEVAFVKLWPIRHFSSIESIMRARIVIQFFFGGAITDSNFAWLAKTKQLISDVIQVIQAQGFPKSLITDSGSGSA